jgi:cyclophilin family peptidyl-prolyl cis-trans isomerase
MRRAPLLALALAGAGALAACGDSGSSTPTTIGPTTCAAADGSSARQDHFLAIPPECLVPGKAYVATIETNYGTLHVNLRADIAPITVNSFVNLARFHYYDDTTCHRAIQNFVVQCGDPTATGRGNPGYTIPDELDLIEPYRFGSVAMANSGRPDSGGSQFFIISGDDGTMLPQKYTLFGQVIDDDIAVVMAMNAVANPADGAPLQPIDIIKITVDEH